MLKTLYNLGYKMCFPFLSFRKHKVPDFQRFYECSCDICGKNFENIETLIKHMGSHEIWEINARLNYQFGTVRCNKCWKSFTSAVIMGDHTCTNVIAGLSPVASSDNLETILIHDTYTQEDNHNNS